jgi:hypothetical protein
MASLATPLRVTRVARAQAAKGGVHEIVEVNGLRSFRTGTIAGAYPTGATRCGHLNMRVPLEDNTPAATALASDLNEVQRALGKALTSAPLRPADGVYSAAIIFKVCESTQHYTVGRCGGPRARGADWARATHGDASTTHLQLEYTLRYCDNASGGHLRAEVTRVYFLEQGADQKATYSVDQRTSPEPAAPKSPDEPVPRKRKARDDDLQLMLAADVALAQKAFDDAQAARKAAEATVLPLMYAEALAHAALQAATRRL